MQTRWSKFKALFWEPATDEDDDDERADEAHDDGEMADALATLKELQGVVGSIAVDAIGRVQAHDLPSVFDATTLRLVGARMLELKAVLSTDDSEQLSGSLEFEGHSFHVRALPHGMVGVLLDPGAHRPTIGMALNLVSRRVAAKLEGVSARGVAP